MIEAELPENEESRLRKLYELGILDTLEEQAYDDLTKLAAEICQTPIALVSLVDSDSNGLNHTMVWTHTKRLVNTLSAHMPFLKMIFLSLKTRVRINDSLITH